uniref:Cytochrome b5 heme-binding domain-containing protein n=2 Tax=Schistocephalus solidus TaxID=70667 RepID=A0A0X3Q996_SCHSO
MMWRFTAVAVVIIATIGSYFYPGSNRYTGEVWRSLSSNIATVPDRLVSLGNAFMEKVYYACGWRVGDLHLNEETNLPECMRQPMDVDQLRPHIHLSLLGHVFDVSANSKVYGPGGFYAGMTGRDVTRLIFSSKLPSGSSDSSEETIVKGFALDGLSSTQLTELSDWMKFYSRKYRCVGYIPGPYFSPMGETSDYLKQLVGLLNRRGVAHTDLADLFPPCSSFFDGKSLTLRCNSEHG